MKGYVQTPTGQVHYLEEGAGEPLVVLHQAPSSSAMLTPILQPLADRGYRAIALDLPGHGMSDLPSEPPEVDDYARSVLAAMSELGIDRFDGFGHHTGGSVLMAASQLEPGRVRRIVAYGVALIEAEMAGFLAAETTPPYDEKGGDLMNWWSDIYRFAGPELGPTVAARGIADLLLCGEGRSWGHNAVGRADNAGLIDRLRVPTLALAGSREMLREQSEKAAAVSTWIEFEELGDAGIFVADEVPDELSARIDAFLRRSDDEVPRG